jgi:hypothetical protein
MKLITISKLLLSFFENNNSINHIHHTQKTNKILNELYIQILNAYHYLLHIKNQKGSQFYNINIKRILNSSQISKSKKFGFDLFPKEVRNHIEKMSMTEISYTFSLFNREIKLIFIIEKQKNENQNENLKEFDKYVDSIIMWLYILNEYSSNMCSQKITIFFYFTSLEKELPETNMSILNENNVNTAFTTTCPKDSEIIIFRKEEWFKVLIHESIHNFGLDFSNMDISISTKIILNLFPVKSEVTLFESYTELWAEIMNALFCSFFHLKDKNNKNNKEEFFKNAEFFLNFERCYSFFQLVKTLDFMGLSYTDLFSNTLESKKLRDTLYKEDSNVLSYYIIKTILINNYPSFLSWCQIYNTSLLQFKQTNKNQIEYCNLIKENYKTKTMLENVNLTNQFFNKINFNKLNSKKTKKMNYLLSNMRMSICELG